MKKAILVLILISLCLSAWAQCPTSSSSFSFYTQSKLDAFAANYPNCTELPRLGIYHHGFDEEDPAIYNLNALNQVTSIAGNLTIEYALIDNLSGLNNLETIGGDFIINDLQLTDLNGLESLTYVGGDLFPTDFGIDIGQIQSSSGLENLTYVGGDFITRRGVTPASLSSLTTVGGDFWIWGPTSANLNGLENLTSVGGELHIFQSFWLTDMNALANLNSIGGLYIYDNNNLSVCNIPPICSYIVAGGTANINYNAPGCNSQAEIEAACMSANDCPNGDIIFTTQQEIDDFPVNYPECTEIVGHLVISPYFDNFPADITDLSPLSQIVSVGGFLRINGNDMLNSLTGLEGITSVGDDIAIYDNNNLTNLNGLENVTFIGQDIAIYNNESLNNLTGLDNINYTTIDNLYINDNPQLTICNIQTVCDYIANGGTATLADLAKLFL